MLGERKRSVDAEVQGGFPVSRIVLTPDCIALVEEKTLRPSPGTTMAEMRTGTRRPAPSMMYTQMVPAAVAKAFLLNVGHDVLRLLQPLVIPHTFPQSRNNLLVHQVDPRVAVHNHRELQ